MLADQPMAPDITAHISAIRRCMAVEWLRTSPTTAKLSAIRQLAKLAEQGYALCITAQLSAIQQARAAELIMASCTTVSYITTLEAPTQIMSLVVQQFSQIVAQRRPKPDGQLLGTSRIIRSLLILRAVIFVWPQTRRASTPGRIRAG